MYQLILFAAIYGAMMFIWSFVYLNKSRDQINQSFLLFLSVILLWMILSVTNAYSDGSALGLTVKTVYWLSMMNMSLFFLHFIYRLIRRKLDLIFYASVALNTLTIAARYCLPMDYADPTFWRLDTPVIAPLMSGIFSLPVAVALVLVGMRYHSVREARQRVQLRYFFAGIALACAVSIVSEYLLPTVFSVNTQLYLMHVAIFIFVLFTFISIMRYRFLNIQSDYIFRKMFLNASDGIIIVNHHQRVVSVNNRAREVFGDEHMDSGDRITDLIPDYRFDTDYRQHEFQMLANGRELFLSVTQYPIDTAAPDTVKLLMVTDITDTRHTMEEEKNRLIEKSSVDQLTGLYNKQYFIDKYYTGTKGRGGAPLSLLFLDVDDFKSINDQHGHLAGDKVLKTLASCVKAILRSDTDVIRFGGDEFIVVLEDARAQEAFAVAERIRKCVGEIDLTDIAANLRLSLSIGLVESRGPVNDMVMKADMAMYSSKSKGKNRTTVFYENDADTIFRMKL